MDWKLAVAEERAALKRIVALLSALADLAERAGSRSPAVRGFVLWVLLQAEAVARDLIGGTLAPDLDQAGDSRADAMCLAARFRDLAHELDCRTTLAFAICSGDSRGNEPALLGVRWMLHIRAAISAAMALASPTSALNTVRLVALPDTS